MGGGKLQVDDIQLSDITRGDDYLIAISRMLNQLATQLVKLRFLSNVIEYKGKSLFGNFDYIPPTRFKLPRMMSKLRLFRNDLVDIFRCSDDLFESMSAMETLLIGDINRHPRFVNKILRNVCSAKMIWPTLRNLRIVELHDPQLLEGLQEAFPNLVKLTVDTRHAADFRRLNTTMKLPFVLPACLGWEGLKHLNLALPRYPEKIVDVIKILLDCKDLLTQLKTFQITKYESCSVYSDLTEGELDLFKELLSAMNGMEEVELCQFYLSQRTVKTMLAFMKTNKISRIRIIQDGKILHDID
ncbi:uncharacterized protein LOC118437041 [Folsomia candida]|uniref:uncharacterized protein LOC118437041 n=1 Tax=Folsomia candida TaxID=158441 RepID=UPI001604B91B|nr:uncharacterized protein LOC118437041 [Folsomia candida]